MEKKSAGLGNRIRLALKKSKKTQRALSKALGVSESNITFYIQESTEPSVEGLALISDFCNVSLDWLITGEGPMQKEMFVAEHLNEEWCGIVSGPTDEEMKDIPAAFQEIIRAGKKLSLAKQYRFAADALEKIAEYEAEEIRKREREEKED